MDPQQALLGPLRICFQTVYLSCKNLCWIVKGIIVCDLDCSCLRVTFGVDAVEDMSGYQGKTCKYDLPVQGISNL